MGQGVAVAIFKMMCKWLQMVSDLSSSSTILPQYSMGQAGNAAGLAAEKELRAILEKAAG